MGRRDDPNGGPRRVSLQDLARLVRRAIVNDDQLEVAERLIQNAADRPVERARAVVGRQDDTDEGGRSNGVSPRRFGRSLSGSSFASRRSPEPGARATRSDRR